MTVGQGKIGATIKSLWTVVRTQTIENVEAKNVFSDTLIKAQDLPTNP